MSSAEAEAALPQIGIGEQCFAVDESGIARLRPAYRLELLPNL